MIEVRPFAELGRFDNDWLNARYHFSFGHYHDPARDGLGPLLVWNDDIIAPGGGFDLHGHRDMEIVTYVREGAISHRDHLGNEGRTEAGDVQVMTAGKGILHAEHNLEAGPTRLFQIWIRPQTNSLKPRWEQRRSPPVIATAFRPASIWLRSCSRWKAPTSAVPSINGSKQRAFAPASLGSSRTALS